MQNILLEPSLQDRAYFPFDQLKDADFPEAFATGIQQAKANIAKIAADSRAPDFANTIEAMEFHRATVDRVSTIFFNLTGANTNDFLKSYAKEISPKLAELSNDLLLNDQIFARVSAVQAEGDASLNTEQKQLLDKTYKAFRRNGASLSAEEKEKLRGFDRRLAVLGQEFSDHVLQATNDYALELSSPADIAGLPHHVVEAAAAEAKARGKTGWVFTLQYPSFGPFLQFAENASRRQELWFAFASRANKGEIDNKPVLKEITSLRYQRAQLLGYKNYGDFVLEERMAGSPERVQEFLEELLRASKPAAQKDFAELSALKKELTGDPKFHPWDNAFYTEKLKQKKFQLSDEELRPYFQLENVIAGVFEHAKRLYGLHFFEKQEIPVYHPDVKTYEVQDKDGAFVGLFYADFFPRAAKRGGAWMTLYREQGLSENGWRLRPHVSIVCNFTKPTATDPSLLNLQEVKTLFHEFGHSLHNLLSDCHYPSLAGTNVYWDFVELPSQVMENWATEKESLALFARHYKTGEIIPDALVKKIKAASSFQAGYLSVRQLSLGLLDMAWHSADPKKIGDVEDFEYESIREALFFPRTPGTCISSSFSHIFAGGYGAGYYSYKWAEVLDADAFEYFLEKGIFNEDVAKKFREHVLARGGTEHPMVLYKRFRGREPDPKALLRRDGLL